MRSAVATLLFCSALVAGEFPVGSKVDKIQVTDHGKATTINPSSAKATAVVFVSTQCPVSNAYNQRFTDLYRDYSGKDVQFTFVNANNNESVSEIDNHAKSQSFPFTVYKDENNVLADKLNAQYTPEVFLFDKSGKLVYHGRIDDSRELSNVKAKDTRAALDAMIAGKAVPTAETKAFGCTIKRVKGTS
jgi:thioredoxin-related protein